MLIDMHIHTSCSPCSVIRIDRLFETALDIGLDGICITDHDTSACQSILAHTGAPPGLSVIVGMEYTTTAGDFLLFGPIDSLPEGLSGHDLLLRIRKEGGIAIPAHPFRSDRPADKNILAKCEVVEAINGRNLPHENALCMEWISRNPHLTKSIGGSDAHTLPEIGQSVTLFSCDIYSSEDLIRALHEGNYAPHSLNNSIATHVG